MDFPIYVNTISIRLPLVHIKGSQVEYSKSCFAVPEDCFYLRNSADPDLGLHCLPEYRVMGFHYTKGYIP